MKNFKRIIYSKYKLDNELNIIEIDDEFTNITGYTKNDIRNLNISQLDLIPKEDRVEYTKEVYNQLSTNHEAYIEHRILRKDGIINYVYCLGTANSDGSNIVRIFVLDDSLYKSIREKSFNRRINDLRNEAKIDDLTGLLRREPYINSVNYHLRKNDNIGFIILDCDYFKKINDTYGHQAGDDVLTSIADLLTECVDDGLICRLGGDEFSISLINMDKEEMVTICETIVRKVNELRIESGTQIIDNLSVSMGVKILANYRKKYNFEELYNLADKALYESKENGRNRYTLSK